MKLSSIKEIISSLVFIGITGTLFALNLVKPAPDILAAERRIPAGFPQISAQEILSGSFTGKIEDWACDNFASRDAFRSINSFLVFDIYRQNDKAGLYRDEAGLGKFKSIEHSRFAGTAKKILDASKVFDGLDANFYFSVIPDKSEYAGRYRPGFAAGEAMLVMSETLTGFKPIQLSNTLSTDSYYRTDMHWNQIMIGDTANTLLKEMGADTRSGQLPGAAAGVFYGIYAGEYALPIEPDTLYFADIQGLKVSYLSNSTMMPDEGPLYSYEHFSGIDPYDFFLLGPQPLAVIENRNAPERELYMFRDSYASSLAPLLADSYSKITLIDLRYIHISQLGRYIDFVPGADVLFIYSSQILGSPDALQS